MVTKCRPLICGVLFCVLCTVAIYVIQDREDSVSLNDDSLLETSLTNRRQNLADGLSGSHKQSFADWYRQQSADAWFGSATFTQNHGIKKNHKRWLTEDDIKSIPAVERAKANSKLKARLIELSMDMLEQEKKANHLVAALKSKLAEESTSDTDSGNFVYSPTLTDGDYDDLNVTSVNSIISSLDLQFQNRTVMSSDDFDRAHDKMTAAQIAALLNQTKENDAAGIDF